MVDFDELYQETQRNHSIAVRILVLGMCENLFTIIKFFIIAMDSPSNFTRGITWKIRGRVGSTFQTAFSMKSVYE